MVNILIEIDIKSFVKATWFYDDNIFIIVQISPNLITQK